MSSWEAVWRFFTTGDNWVGANGIGTKAAMVGWLLAQAAKEDLGQYAKANDAFLTDLAPDGIAPFQTGLLATYGPPASTTPGAMITVGEGQSEMLRMLDVTSVLSEELDLFRPELRMPNPEIASVSEGVILLRYVELRSQVHRLLSILKMRETEYDTSLREFRIGPRGIEVEKTFQSAEAVLSGHGRVLGGSGRSS